MITNLLWYTLYGGLLCQAFNTCQTTVYLYYELSLKAKRMQGIQLVIMDLLSEKKHC